jgi:hypothetical protein
MKKKALALFFGFWLGTGLIFWFWEGNSLKYDVYSAATYRYSEDFSTTGRVIISSLIGLVTSVFLLLICWFFSYVTKRVKSK